MFRAAIGYNVAVDEDVNSNTHYDAKPYIIMISVKLILQ